MSSFYGRSGPSELLPRSIFLKPLVTGRRVLELGTVSATGGATAVALLRLGARTVTAFDEDEAAVERAREEHRGSGVSFRTGRADELPERSFDLVLVDDAARIVAPGVAAALGRLLSPNGHLVVPIRNPAGPSLAGLAGAAEVPETGWAAATSALRPFFPSIEVATQQLLVGYVLAPVNGGPAKLDIDASAAGTAAAYWLLLCGQTPAGLVDQALVALPPEPLFGPRERLAPPDDGRLAEAEAERDRAAERAERARDEVERLTARAAELEAALGVERRRVEELRRAADRAAEGLRERENWVDGLRAEVEGREEAETRTQAELREATARLGRLEPELKNTQEMLRRVRDQLAAKIHELAAARQAISERNEDLRIAEEELERARAYARQEREARLASERAGERLAALEAELATAKVEREGFRVRVEALERERDDAVAERERLRRRCEELERAAALVAGTPEAVANEAVAGPLAADRERLVAPGEAGAGPVDPGADAGPGEAEAEPVVSGAGAVPVEGGTEAVEAPGAVAVPVEASTGPVEVGAGAVPVEASTGPVEVGAGAVPVEGATGPVEVGAGAVPVEGATEARVDPGPAHEEPIENPGTLSGSPEPAAERTPALPAEGPAR